MFDQICWRSAGLEGSHCQTCDHQTRGQICDADFIRLKVKLVMPTSSDSGVEVILTHAGLLALSDISVHLDRRFFTRQDTLRNNRWVNLMLLPTHTDTNNPRTRSYIHTQCARKTHSATNTHLRTHFHSHTQTHSHLSVANTLLTRWMCESVLNTHRRRRRANLSHGGTFPPTELIDI